jgi:hypothetical protein
MAITNTILTTSVANIHVSSGNTIVSAMYFCNLNGSAQSFSLYAVPSGSIADAGTQIYKSVLIQPNDTYVIDMEKFALADGETLRANASVNSAITATVSYLGI